LDTPFYVQQDKHVTPPLVGLCPLHLKSSEIKIKCSAESAHGVKMSQRSINTHNTKQ